MKHIHIISAIIGAAALSPAITTMAGQPSPTDYQSMVQLRQSAQAEYQNKMREWSMGLGVDLPGTPQLTNALHNAPAGIPAEAAEPYRATYQDMKQLQLAKATEYQSRMREWATGLGVELPGAGIVAQPSVPNTTIADRGRTERGQVYGHEADEEHTQSAVHDDDDEDHAYSREAEHDERDDMSSRCLI